MVFDQPEEGGLRIESRRLTRGRLIRQLEAESGLEDAERCDIFVDVFSEHAGWEPSELARFGNGACAGKAH